MNDLANYERAILKHIYNQMFSGRQEIVRVSSRDCCDALILTCREYLKAGSPKRQEFYDCCGMLLRMSAARMSEYMIQLEELKQARDLLVFLELVHDLITMKSNTLEEYTRVFSGGPPTANINEFVASVLSKINRFAS